MKRVIIGVAIVLGAAAYALVAEPAADQPGAGAAAVAPAPAAKPARIAIANIDDMYKEYKWRADRMAKLQEWGRQAEEQSAAMEKELTRLREQLKTLAMATPQYNETKKRADELETGLRKLMYDANQVFDAQMSSLSSDVFADIVQAVKQYSEANGIDLVIKQQVYKPRKGSLPEAVNLDIQRQGVLYQSPAMLDITKEATEVLNAGVYQERLKIEAKKAEEAKAEGK